MVVGSNLFHKSIQHALFAGTVEVDGQFIAFDRGNIAIAEFEVENTVADEEFRGLVSHGFRHQFAVDGAGARAAFAVTDALHRMAGACAPIVAGGVAAVLLGAFPAGGGVIVGEGIGLVETGLAVTAASAITAIIAVGSRDIHMGGRQFVEETRGQGGLPQPVNAPVRDEPDMAELLGAGDADISQTTFFLQTGATAFVQRPLVGKQAFFPTGQEDGVEFQTLGGMQRHDGDGIQLGILFRIHNQGDVTYKAAAGGSAILVQKDSPLKTLEDLKGKKVAFKRGSSAHNVTVKALRKAGLTLSDITPVDLAPPDAAAAFRSGSIDAWSIWDPYFAVAEKEPTTRVLSTAEGIVDPWSYFLANGDFVEANPDLVPLILKELANVGAKAQANIDATAKSLAAITGVPEDVTKVSLTRPGADLGRVSLVPDEAIAYQQALADEFYDLKIVPKKLKVTDIVWRPKAS